MANKKNLKARPKVTPFRIQANIQRKQAIVQQEIVDNEFTHIAETEELTVADLPNGQTSVPLNLWLDNKAKIMARDGLTAVQIGSDELPEDLVNDLADIDVIVLPFTTHNDGRSYSHAYKLRQRYGFKGQIRAIGDVKFDQLDFLNRVGCDAFELPDEEDLKTALRAFNEFSTVYQPSTDGAHLIFSRRRAVH